MSAISIKHFNTIEQIQKLRKVNFTEEQAEAVIEIVEQQAQIIQDQSNKISLLENKEIATKRDLAELKLDLVKWMIGIIATAVFTLGGTIIGMLAKGFHWL